MNSKTELPPSNRLFEWQEDALTPYSIRIKDGPTLAMRRSVGPSQLSSMLQWGWVSDPLRWQIQTTMEFIM